MCGEFKNRRRIVTVTPFKCDVIKRNAFACNFSSLCFWKTSCIGRQKLVSKISPAIFRSRNWFALLVRFKIHSYCSSQIETEQIQVWQLYFIWYRTVLKSKAAGFTKHHRQKTERSYWFNRLWRHKRASAVWRPNNCLPMATPQKPLPSEKTLQPQLSSWDIPTKETNQEMVENLTQGMSWR